MHKERRDAEYQIGLLFVQCCSPSGLTIVEHRDKPDFVLLSESRQVGLEVSDVADEELHRASALVPSDQWITTTSLRDVSIRKSNPVLIATATNILDGPWEDALKLDRHAASKVLAAIIRKQDSFHSSDFKRYQNNWLFLTNAPTHRFRLPVTDDCLFTILEQALATRPSPIGSEFDRIYLLNNHTLFLIDHRKLTRCQI